MPRLRSNPLLYLLSVATVFYLFAMWYDFPPTNGISKLKERLRNTKIRRKNIYQEDVTLEELENGLYTENGYEVVQVTSPIPTLRFIQEPTCDQIYTNWNLTFSKQSMEPPPRRLTPEMQYQMTMNNYSTLVYNYRNNSRRQKPAKWDILSELMTWNSEILGALSFSFDGVSLHYAMKQHELNDKNGVIVGSLIPWVEVLSLQHGASNILTIEHNKLDIEERFRDRVYSITPVEFAMNFKNYSESFDFAAAFSSIEYIGLGQYGEPIDPYGDLREIQKIRCALKPGGLLFLGLPLDLMQ